MITLQKLTTLSILVVLSNLIFSTSNPIVEQRSCLTTPELTALQSWTQDLRTAAQTAPLPPASTDCPMPTARQKVLMIGIDGLRTDAIAMLPLPNIHRLERMGTYSYWSNVQSTASAVSGPGWTSLMTGVEADRHLVGGNSDLRDLSPSFPTFLKLVKDSYPDKTVAASVSWHPLIDDLIDFEDPTTLDGSHKASSDEDMASVAESWIRNGDYDVIFVDFDDCDHAGHSSGFDGYGSVYGAAVIKTDKLVGDLLDAILTRSDGEEWLIVLTSDHGGQGTSHGGDDPYNRHVPFMVASNSPRVAIGQRMPPNDPGSHMDVLPTIMHFFGGPTTVPSYLDGQVFGFNDYNRTIPDGPCPDSNPERCGCRHVNQADYRGRMSTTEDGIICQRWDVQTPHAHTRTPEAYPGSGLDENYCRNPDGEARAWCYTTDPTQRWGYCNVPVCGMPYEPTASPNVMPTASPVDNSICGSATVKQADYRGVIDRTVGGLDCQRWDVQSPHGHTRTPERYPESGLEENYCRNPDGEPRAWCYTTDPGIRWDYCNVPLC